jgi:hypothetical protein
MERRVTHNREGIINVIIVCGCMVLMAGGLTWAMSLDVTFPSKTSIIKEKIIDNTYKGNGYCFIMLNKDIVKVSMSDWYNYDINQTYKYENRNIIKG